VGRPTSAQPSPARAGRAPERDERELGRDELAALLAINRAIGRHLHRDELFGALATCLKDVLPTERFGIEMPIAGERLQGHLLTPRGVGEEPTRPTVLPAAGTACDWVLRHRRWIVTARRAELRERFPITFEVMEGAGMESLCALPLLAGQSCPAVLFFMAAAPGAYGDLPRALLEQIASAVAVALDDCLAHEEVRRLRDQLAAENVYLQEEIKEGQHFGEIVGNGPALGRVMDLVERVAPTNATVLILGETGTGKELIARAVHERSPRRERALVKVNCAAIASGLVESELFGHVRGAFTGAVANRSGRFALADGGTIFLDEIGELPLDTQVKLLRVLQEREFEPLGSSRAERVDVRVIAATNRDLERAVAEGRFRADLYYRLNVMPIRVPPLRERREDVPALVHYLAARSAREIGKRIDGVSRRALAELTAYDWPGNVRELQNVIERAVVLATGPMLEIEPEFLRRDGVPAACASVPAPPAPGARAAAAGSRPAGDDASASGAAARREDASLEGVARGHVRQVLERCGWRIDGPGGAAQLLGLKPSTLRSRMKKLGLARTAS
jgi:formate hydrogenlyase transcriptional activator